MLLSVLLIGTASAAGCDVDSLTAEVAAARAAFNAMEPEAFTAARQQLGQTLACLDTPVPPPTAAAVHGILALEAYLARDEARTVAAFQAAALADPDFSLDGWLPERHPIGLEWRLAQRLETPTATPFSTKGVEIWVDGRPADGRVLDQPAVLQRTEAGRVSDSLLWVPPGPTPGWADATAPRVAPEVKRHLILGSLLAASLATTGVVLGVADSAESRFADAATPYDELESLRQRANRMSASGIGTATTYLGLATALVITW